jgi:DME family drug/metabolite transporter
MLYGSAYVATAFALRSFTPIATATDRSVVAALLLGLIVAVRQRGTPDAARTDPAVPRSTRTLHLAVLGLLGGAIFLAGQSLAVAHVGATVAAFVAGLYAVLAAVISPIVLREPLGRRALVGFVLALIGTLLLAQLDIGRTDLVGIGWGLAAAIAFAFFLVLGRKWSRTDGLDPLSISLAVSVVAAPVLAALGVASATATFLPTSITPEAAIALVWLVVVVAAGLALTAASVRLIPASRSAAFLLLNPITAALLAAVLLGERPTELQLAGGALVLLGIGAATIRR